MAAPVIRIPLVPADASVFVCYGDVPAGYCAILVLPPPAATPSIMIVEKDSVASPPGTQEHTSGFYHGGVNLEPFPATEPADGVTVDLARATQPELEGSTPAMRRSKSLSSEIMLSSGTAKGVKRIKSPVAELEGFTPATDVKRLKATGSGFKSSIPANDRKKWDAVDDRILLEHVRKHGIRQWGLVQEALERTIRAIKNRWYYVLRHQNNVEENEAPPAVEVVGGSSGRADSGKEDSAAAPAAENGEGSWGLAASGRGDSGAAPAVENGEGFSGRAASEKQDSGAVPAVENDEDSSDPSFSGEGASVAPDHSSVGDLATADNSDGLAEEKT